MDESAIREINNNSAASALSKRLNDTEVPVAALPNDFSLHSLEKYEEFRSRYRACLKTSNTKSFAHYYDQQVIRKGTPVFINPDNMTAEAIFDLGDSGEPGHCEHRALLKMAETAPFAAYCSFMKNPDISQREMAEWIEDWRDYILAFDGEGNIIETKRLIATVRKLDIEKINRSESSEGNFSSARSSLESVDASSSVGALPTELEFKTEPYHDLPEQYFRFRISLRTGGDRVRFGVFRIREDMDKERTGDRFVKLMHDHLGGDATIYQGDYSC